MTVGVIRFRTQLKAQVSFLLREVGSRLNELKLILNEPSSTDDNPASSPAVAMLQRRTSRNRVHFKIKLSGQ